MVEELQRGERRGEGERALLRTYACLPIVGTRFTPTLVLAFFDKFAIQIRHNDGGKAEEKLRGV